MIKYNIRSRDLLSLYNEIRQNKLIPKAYFQRNLVWRDSHKKELIKTIKLGFPFPVIFISKGEIDLERMETVSCIVDGQQRLNAISLFVDNQFAVDGGYFRDLSPVEKEVFFKYEIAVVELDLKNDDPQVREIFARLNKSSSSLSGIEKMSSEFGVTEYMLVAKYLIGEFSSYEKLEDEIENFKIDPNIPKSFFDWASVQSNKDFLELINSEKIFSPREISRKVNLFYTLNLMSTIVSKSFFNRNELTLEYLESMTDLFEKKDDVVYVLNKVAHVYKKLKLPNKSMWSNKANFFSLMVSLAFSLKLEKVDLVKLRNELVSFEESCPEEYALAAKESLNNKKERMIRNSYIEEMIERSSF